MKLALYGALTVCGFFMAYAFAEDPELMREAAGMTIGVVMMYVGALGLRRIGGDLIDDIKK